MSCNCSNPSYLKEKYAGFFKDYKSPKVVKKAKKEAQPEPEQAEKTEEK